jgi:hypothetical protein
VIGAALVCLLVSIPAPATAGDEVDPAKVMVPAQMELTPAKPRAGERVTIRVDGFEHAREVSPHVPSGETVEPTGQPAPFLAEQRREPQVIAYYGGTWLREPLKRVGRQVFEAKLEFPHEGNWRIGPFFYRGDFRWTQRVAVPVADTDASPSPPTSRRFELELASEGDPVNAPTWLKPIAFAFLGALFLGALWLVVVQLRMVRRGGIVRVSD